jgi:predicted PurR-regulated permease PerM
MNTSRFLTLAAKPVLFLLEYLFKLSAGVIAMIVMGAGGSFFGKLGTGFGSIGNVLNQVANSPDQLAKLGTIIQDYNTLTAAEFNQRYGGEAINRVMESLNEAVAYGQAVYQNLTQQLMATIVATLFVFLLFYISGRVCRFYRQRGQGSFLIKKERELGKRVFDRSGDTDYH